MASWRIDARKNNIPVHLYRPVLGENYLDIFIRINIFMKILKKLYQASRKFKQKGVKNVLLVTHGGVITAIHKYLAMVNQKAYKGVTAKNCRIHVVEIKGDFEMKEIACNVEKLAEIG